LNELADELPKGCDGNIALLAQPLPQLGLVGKLFDPGQLPGQRLVIEPLGVGQAGPAGAERIEQLSHEQLRAVTVGGAHAGINPRQGANFIPKAKLLRQRLHRRQAAQGGFLLGGDKLEAQFGGTFFDDRHAFLDAANCQLFNAAKNFTRQCNFLPDS
jgi:hypothetical protein